VIAYTLRCHKGHEFEAWFGNSAAFDRQVAEGQVCCPRCNSARVQKAVMAPAVTGTKRSRKPAQEQRRMRQFMTGLRKYVQQHADYVGPNFAEEARKIHYGETPDRHIYGEATVQEARDLVEEGVDVAPLPPDPEAAN
jgi:hypothetical protein